MSQSLTRRDGRPYFGAQLTNLLTIVSKMRQEVNQLVEEDGLCLDNHEALTGLDDIRNSVLTLAEFLGRTKKLPRDRYGEVSVDFYYARKKLTGRESDGCVDLSQMVEINEYRKDYFDEDPFVGFSGSYQPDELDEALVLETPPASVLTIDQMIKFDLDHETSRVAAKIEEEEEIFYPAVECRASVETQLKLGWLTAAKHIARTLSSTESTGEADIIERTKRRQEARKLHLEAKQRRLERMVREYAEKQSQDIKWPPGSPHRKFSFTTAGELGHIDDVEYIRENAAGFRKLRAVAGDISGEAAYDVDGAKGPLMGSCPSCGPGVMGAQYKGVNWCRRCGQQMDEKFVWIKLHIDG